MTTEMSINIGDFVGFQLTFELSDRNLFFLETDLEKNNISSYRGGRLDGKHVLYVDNCRAMDAVELLAKYDNRRCDDLRREIREWKTRCTRSIY